MNRAHSDDTQGTDRKEFVWQDVAAQILFETTFIEFSIKFLGCYSQVPRGGGVVVRMAGHRQLDHAFLIISQPKCIELVPIQAPQARAAATVTAVYCQSLYAIQVVAFRIKPGLSVSQ